MKKKSILLTALVSLTILGSTTFIVSCNDTNEEIEEPNEDTYAISLYINDENGGSISFYHDGNTIDLTDEGYKDELEIGDSLSFRITVSSGYSFESILLNGSNLSVSNNIGSFTILEGANELTLNFREITTNDSDFTFEFDEENQEATVTRYSTSNLPNPIVIPETVTHNGVTYQVTGIGSQAFITSGAEAIYISRYIRDIADDAFYLSTYFLKSLEVDENNEFYASSEGILYSKDYSTVIAVPNSLTSVTLEEEVTALDPYAFSNGAIRSIDIPESVTEIGESCFYRCTSLTTVTGCEGLVTIGDYAFNYTNITSFNFAEGLTSIGEYSFAETDLSSIKLPNSLTSIPDCAFYHISDLSSVDFGSVTSIGFEAFWNCGFTSIQLPSTLKTIEEGAFQQCWSLQNVTFKEGLETIGNYAFDQDYSLIAINLPSSIKSIGIGAFRAIPSFGNNFTIGSNNDNEYYKIVDGILYQYNDDDSLSIHTYPMGHTSSEESGEVIDEDLNVSSILEQSFSYARNLVKLTLPSTLKTIEANAFYGIYTDESTNTELELLYNGTIEEFEANVTLEEGWNNTLTVKDNVITCNDGTFSISI